MIVAKIVDLSESTAVKLLRGCFLLKKIVVTYLKFNKISQ